MIATIPKIDFNVETVEYKNLIFTMQKDTEVIHREVKGGTKINCDPKENRSELSEKSRLKDLAKKHSEHANHTDSLETATQKVKKTVITQVRA